MSSACYDIRQTMTPMKIDILTIFPQMFAGPFDESMIQRAQEKHLVQIGIHDLRFWAKDKHKSVDDRPYGGGPGMVLRVDVIDRAISQIKAQKTKTKIQRVVLLTPQGQLFKQKTALKLSKLKHLILIAGHYEGVDERVRKYLVDEEISIGDYVLTGGEIPAMVVTDAVVRLIPGVLGDAHSLDHESFSTIGEDSPRLLEYPQYTRPELFKRWSVPKVLISGNHAEISRWRESQSRKRTETRRPELLRK